jgi:hypothetical protein
LFVFIFGGFSATRFFVLFSVFFMVAFGDYSFFAPSFLPRLRGLYLVDF